MTRPVFPREPDRLPRAWGLTGATPRMIWERFSPAYEAQAERVAHAIEAAGLVPEFGGAGSEDGEYLTGIDATGEYVILIHLENPQEAKRMARLDDDGLARFVAQSAG